MRRVPFVIATVLALAAPLAATAQDRPPPGGTWPTGEQPQVPPRPWSQLTPDEKDILSPVAHDWDSFPARKQSHMLEMAQRWKGLPPERRAEIRERIDRWQHMTPEERAEARKNQQKFQDLSPAQRAKLHDAFERFRTLPPAQKQALMEKWRNQTPEQRRQAIDNMGPNDALPPPPPHGDRPGERGPPPDGSAKLGG
jgi:hypothetical protein